MWGWGDDLRTGAAVAPGESRLRKDVEHRLHIFDGFWDPPLGADEVNKRSHLVDLIYGGDRECGLVMSFEFSVYIPNL